MRPYDQEREPGIDFGPISVFVLIVLAVVSVAVLILALAALNAL